MSKIVDRRTIESSSTATTAENIKMAQGYRKRAVVARGGGSYFSSELKWLAVDGVMMRASGGIHQEQHSWILIRSHHA